jgi:hypothetical protein
MAPMLRHFILGVEQYRAITVEYWLTQLEQRHATVALLAIVTIC